MRPNRKYGDCCEIPSHSGCWRDGPREMKRATIFYPSKITVAAFFFGWLLFVAGKKNRNDFFPPLFRVHVLIAL